MALLLDAYIQWFHIGSYRLATRFSQSASNEGNRSIKLDVAKTEFEPYRMHAIFVFERSDGRCRLVHRASQFYPPARLGIPLPLLSALSGKGMPLSVEISCVLAIYGLASILHRKNYY